MIIFEKSLVEGKVPAEWEKGTVVPIFKKGSKRATINYRLVSLAIIPCKILESLIKDAVMDHLLTKNLIKSTQHGCTPGRSCITNQNVVGKRFILTSVKRLLRYLTTVLLQS
jgi:hypothetical protein